MQFINPSDLPPEVVAALQQHFDMHEMSHENNSHEQQRLLTGLTEEQLLALRTLLSQVAPLEPGSTFTQGYISALLHERFNHCACGSSHEVSDITETSESGEGVEDAMDKIKYADESHSWEDIVPDLLAEYNLEQRTEIRGVTVPAYLICAGCETPVVSLDDRLKRPPGVKGCATCQDKAKWG